MSPAFNWSRRKVGGIWFFKLGRFNLSFSVSRTHVPRTFDWNEAIPVRVTIPQVDANYDPTAAQREFRRASREGY